MAQLWKYVLVNKSRWMISIGCCWLNFFHFVSRTEFHEYFWFALTNNVYGLIKYWHKIQWLLIAYLSIDVTVWSITSISDNETYDDLKSLNIEPISLCFHNQISFQEVLISATSCLQLIRGQSWHQNQNSWARACVLTEDCCNTPNQIF